MSTLGKRRIQAAEEARTIARSEADPSTYKVHVPAEIDVKAIRLRLKMTQAEFSARYGFPLGTTLVHKSIRGIAARLAARCRGGSLKLRAACPTRPRKSTATRSQRPIAV